MGEMRDRAGLPPSPCRRICRQNPEAGFCEGCGRTVREVFTWNAMSDADRAGLMAELPARLARLSHG